MKRSGEDNAERQSSHLFFGEPFALTAASALPFRAWPLDPPLASRGAFSFSSSAFGSSSSSSLRSSATMSKKTTR